MRGTEKRAHGRKGRPRRRDDRENRFPGGPGDQPPAGDPGHSPRFYKQPNTVHPPPVLPSSPGSVALLFSVALFFVSLHRGSSAFAPPRRLKDSDKRGQLTGVFGMQGAKDELEQAKRERDRCRDSYRENPMTRCLRDTTLFKVATGGFAFALISRDGSLSRGIVPGQVLSWR